MIQDSPVDAGATPGEMRSRIRDHDWASTPLGPVASWPPTLRTAVDLMLDCAQPAYIGWGPELVSLYNDGYIPFVGGRHPDTLGRPYRQVWPQLWDEFQSLIDDVFDGQSRSYVDHPVALAGRPGRPMSWFSFAWTPLRDEAGKVGGIYCTAIETTERVLAERDVRGTYRALFESIDEAFCVIKMIFDEDEQPVDYIVLETNPAFERHTGLVDAVGRRMREIAPDHETFWYRTYGRIACTGRSERFEHRAEALGRWYNVHAFRVGDPEQRRVAVLFDDITARRQAEQALLRRESLYQSLFESIDEGFCIVELELDAEGGVADLVFREVNHAFGRHTGLTAARDRRASELLPNLERHWIDMYHRVWASGVPARGENHAADIDRWFRAQYFRVGARQDRRVGVVFEDITRTKRAEQARRDSQARLAAAFESVPAAIAAIDAQGRTVLANAEYRRFIPTDSIPSRDPVNGDRWRGWDAQGMPLSPDQFPGARALRGERVIPGQEMLYIDDEGREVWTNVAITPTYGEGGQVTGAVTVISDITERRQVLDALRQSEERLRQFGEASQDVLWIRDAGALQWQYLTPAFETIYGLSREQALAGDNYRSWLDLIVPEDREHAHAHIQRVRAGEHVTFEYRIRRPNDGQIRWLRDTDFPILDAAGQVGMVGGIGEDITESRLSQERLEQSEERLRSAVEVGRLGLWDWDVGNGSIHWSDEHFRMEGYAVGEVTPSYETWAARIHPDDLPPTAAALEQAMRDRTEYAREFRVVHPNGSIHWLNGRGRFFYDGHGNPTRMIGAMVETTERREWEERQKVLIAELQHRTRNLLGVVRSLVDKSARASVDLADFRGRFTDRLEALARVQGLLSRLDEHDRVTFDDLLHSELAAMDAGVDRVTLEGPAGIRLRSSTVQTLAMAVHELATNAVKYGALAQANGRLAIRWSLEPAGKGNKPWLHIDWRESGVVMPPPDAAPRGGGQGRELIERALPYQLNATTAYTLGPDGVQCRISVPVSASTP